MSTAEMEARASDDGDHDSFAAAARSRLALQLRITPAERLRDLEAMWDFNEMVWAHNPRVLRIAERLWAMQGR